LGFPMKYSHPGSHPLKTLRVGSPQIQNHYKIFHHVLCNLEYSYWDLCWWDGQWLIFHLSRTQNSLKNKRQRGKCSVHIQ
jgi:hypothetical protein